MNWKKNCCELIFISPQNSLKQFHFVLTELKCIHLSYYRALKSIISSFVGNYSTSKKKKVLQGRGLLFLYDAPQIKNEYSQGDAGSAWNRYTVRCTQSQSLFSVYLINLFSCSDKNNTDGWVFWPESWADEHNPHRDWTVLEKGQTGPAIIQDKVKQKHFGLSELSKPIRIAKDELRLHKTHWYS